MARSLLSRCCRNQARQVPKVRLSSTKTRRMLRTPSRSFMACTRSASMRSNLLMYVGRSHPKVTGGRSPQDPQETTNGKVVAMAPGMTAVVVAVVGKAMVSARQLVMISGRDAETRRRSGATAPAASSLFIPAVRWGNIAAGSAGAPKGVATVRIASGGALVEGVPAGLCESAIRHLKRQGANFTSRICLTIPQKRRSAT
mmetsp:Transcript_73355/g.190479  ORF Transcript_73355/g.190479 Transcript_73355/m.190479 type:complete len:200 (+) Transcript_73355:208-807(+)